MAKRIPIVRVVNVIDEMRRVRKYIKAGDLTYFDMVVDLARAQTQDDSAAELERIFSLEDPRG